MQTRIEIIEKNNGEFTYTPQVREVSPFYMRIIRTLFLIPDRRTWFGLYEKKYEIIVQELVTSSRFSNIEKAKELISKYLKQEELKRLQEIKKITHEKYS